MGGEAELAVGGDVVLDGEAPLGAGDQRAVDRLGQALLGPPLRLGDRLEPLVSHSDPLVMPCPSRTRGGSIGEQRRPGDSTRPARAAPPSPRQARIGLLGSAAWPTRVRPAEPGPEGRARRQLRRRGVPLRPLPPGPTGRGGGLDPPQPGVHRRRPRCGNRCPGSAPGGAGRRGRRGRARRPHARRARRDAPAGAGVGGSGRVDPAPGRQRRRGHRVVVVALDGPLPTLTEVAVSSSPVARWRRSGRGPTRSPRSSSRPKLSSATGAGGP